MDDVRESTPNGSAAPAVSGWVDGITTEQKGCDLAALLHIIRFDPSL